MGEDLKGNMNVLDQKKGMSTGMEYCLINVLTEIGNMIR